MDSQGSASPSRFDLRDLAFGIHENWPDARLAAPGPIDVVDMFSGCGGMSSGFLSVNAVRPSFRLAMAIDIDAVANATYERNLGLKPLRLDVSRLSSDPDRIDEILKESGRRSGNPLVLIGCAPCQGFSSHRNAAGQSDIRNTLFVDFAKIAVALRPDAVVVENVPELLTDRYWPILEEARGLLANAGYSTYLGVHNLAEFGVPQERFRALLLAMPRRFQPPAGFLARASFRTVRDAIGTLPSIQAGEASQTDPTHRTAAHRPETIATIQAVAHDGGNRPADVGPDSLRRIRERQGRGGYDDVYGRLRWDRPSITITAYSRNPASGRYVHPVQDRGLSIREAALLQGFPRTYEFAGSLDEAFRQIGNAVPPAFAACLAGHVLNELAKPPVAGAPEATGIRAPVGSSFARLIAGLKSGHLSLTASGVENVDGGPSQRSRRAGLVGTARRVPGPVPAGG